MRNIFIKLLTETSDDRCYSITSSLQTMAINGEITVKEKRSAIDIINRNAKRNTLFNRLIFDKRRAVLDDKGSTIKEKRKDFLEYIIENNRLYGV